MREGWGDKGEKQQQLHTGEWCSFESCRSTFKFLAFFVTKARVQSAPAVLSLESLTPDSDLRLSLLLGSSGSCAGIPSGSAALSQL